jgi:hypothetical protein
METAHIFFKPFLIPFSNWSFPHRLQFNILQAHLKAALATATPKLLKELAKRVTPQL